MLAAEGALDRAPRCLDASVPRLCALLSRDDVAFVGDTADLLGRIGSRDAATPLRRLLGHPNAELAEAAADALDAIERH
jgi:HEAT repeat protein